MSEAAVISSSSSESDVATVTRALEDPAFVWRTVDGLKTATRLPEEKVLTILHQYPEDELVTTVGRQGRLYTTRQHYNEKQSFWGKLLSAATGKLK